ncbi:hypothetical protein IKG20_00115 [Candidatus Saccharibacteria bacterium]|nr:hypothetical protein [Candidatus Saccharibacteria bacterium]
MKTWKKGLSVALGLGLMLSTTAGIGLQAFAEPESDPIEIVDSDNLYGAFYYGGNYILGADIDYTLEYNDFFYPIFAMGDTILDLNGHTITFDAETEYIITYGGDVTINGEGAIRKTVGDNPYPALWAYGEEGVYEPATITQNGGTVSGIDYAVLAAGGGKFILNGGEVNATEYGITVYSDSEATVNGGKVFSETSYAMTGYGSTSGERATMTVNGGEVISEGDYAIYQPQVDGELTITDGTISGAAGAIAVNRGRVTISDGLFISLGTAELPGNVSEDGTKGYSNAVIGVAKEYGDVDLQISGGTFEAEGNAGMIADPSGLDTEYEALVSATGGVYTERIDGSFIPGGYEIAINAENRWEIVNMEELDKEGMEIEAREYGTPYIVSKEVVLEDIYNENGVGIIFKNGFEADRQARLVVDFFGPEDEEIGDFQLVGDGDLFGIADIRILDRDDEVIPVEDTEMRIFIFFDKDTYDMLSTYDKIEIVFFGADGMEVERLVGELKTETYDEEEADYWIEFTTTHLSAYGVVGVNEEEEEEGGGAAAPETGVFSNDGGHAEVVSRLFGLITAVGIFAFGFKLIKLGKKYRN